MADRGYINSNFSCLAELESRVGGNSAERTLAVEDLETFIFPQLTKGASPSFAGFAPVVEDISKAFLVPSYGDDNLFYRVWVAPILIDLDFITEGDTFEIKIWNAWLSREVGLTAVSVIDQDGTALTYPSLPFTITRSDSLILTLDVYKEGPPAQDTYYGLTVDGILYTINIIGTRIIPIEPDIQWGESPSMGYEFHTVMYQDGMRFKEQRRPLIEYPLRKTSVPYQLEGNSAHKFFNILSYGHDKVFGVPIYNEKIIPSVITLGSNIISLITNTDYLYNLNNNANYVIIVDHETELVEIKEFSAIASTQITVVKEIVENFDVDSTFIYPVFLSLLHAVSFEEVTDNLQTLTVEYREFIT